MSHIPSSGQLRKLELAVAGLCRRAMRGNASWEDAHHVRSLSSQQVLEYWKFIPLCVELRVRRLRWFQGICSFPESHRQLIAA
eukprot:6016420-Pyramimonas_sp.AAC.1